MIGDLSAFVVVPVVGSRRILLLVLLLFLVSVPLIILITFLGASSSLSSLSGLVGGLVSHCDGGETIIFWGSCRLDCALVAAWFDVQTIVVRIWQI
jgi:hypothetical protein